MLLPQTSLGSNTPIQCDDDFSSKKCKRRRIMPEVTQVSAQYSASLKPLDVALNPISECHRNTPLHQSAQTLSPLSNVLLTVFGSEQAWPDVITQSRLRQTCFLLRLKRELNRPRQMHFSIRWDLSKLTLKHLSLVLHQYRPRQKHLGLRQMFLTQTRPEAGALLTETRADEAQSHSLNEPLTLKPPQIFINYT